MSITRPFTIADCRPRTSKCCRLLSGGGQDAWSQGAGTSSSRRTQCLVVTMERDQKRKMRRRSMLGTVLLALAFIGATAFVVTGSDWAAGARCGVL